MNNEHKGRKMGILILRFKDGRGNWNTFDVADMDELECLIDVANRKFNHIIEEVKFVKNDDITKMTRVTDKTMDLLNRNHMIIK
jgi:hypothetical protein